MRYILDPGSKYLLRRYRNTSKTIQNLTNQKYRNSEGRSRFGRRGSLRDHLCFLREVRSLLQSTGDLRGG